MVRRALRLRSKQTDQGTDPSTTVFAGGCLTPLSASELRKIVDHAFEILSNVGMSGLPAAALERALAKGAKLRNDGRVCFGKEMILDACTRAPSSVTLPGFAPNRSLTIGGAGVHIGTGGAAVQVLDASTGGYRDSTLNDLYDLMRVLDASPNIHYGVRPVIARDIADPLGLDINTAFACMKSHHKTYRRQLLRCGAFKACRRDV